ncbi:histidine--tRNA ligase [Sandaracinus amylolyticus]|uniref:Histidine--tRNA ligase n=1 Tax=Sandaracinus amylolyticus TaxID=927083 RepID=A0A0F6W3D6_9BACT|nr:histidine--tRNA ligase [Sandaracinus amylolyticus]AKF06386.1 Histidyl-tRNA synthetase [Sandaracinus amylolyticus]
MNDVLPEAIARWHRVERAFREISTRYGYTEVRTPIVEPTQLFVRSIGEATDIVEKEMYTFEDRGEGMLTLRPEGTAGAVRAFVEHAVSGREPISKWSYLGPMFRRERPQRGRYRQFWQAGLECFGDPGPHVDAEMIELVVTLLASLGVQDLEVLVNSLGSGDTRARYRDALTKYFEPNRDRLSPESQRRLVANPLRILDSKSPVDRELSAGAPSLLEFLDDADREHFDELQRALTALDVKFRVEPTLVRGLDYYSRTLFEVQGRGGELGAQNTICGGGRYDGLVKELGGPDVPSIGFAAGIERILLVMGGEDRAPTIDVAVAVADAALRVDASVLLRDLRAAGLVADGDLRGQSLKSQLRRADKLGAKVVLVLGPAETERGVVQLKDLAAHSSSEVPRAEVVARVRDRVRESA